MGQRLSQIISHVTVDINLMGENVTPEKTETMVYVSLSVKYQQKIVHMEKIMSGIQMYVLANVCAWERL